MTQRKVFISPHNDDECLFGAFTIMRYREDIEVVIVYDSYVQVERGNIACTAGARRKESLDALGIMGVPSERVKFLGLRDTDCNLNDVGCLLRQFSGAQVWYPAYENEGNKHHNAVAVSVAHSLPGLNKVPYMTYTERGKSGSSDQVVPAHWGDVGRKLLAMACYKTQIQLPDCRPHFLRSLEEYYLVVA